jgi:lipopolysaccharide transport system ATP-binding protein
MTDTVIRAENLSKRYFLGKQLGLILGEKKQKNEAFWALKDVSFEIKAGEVVGIIGRNGAGKSTMLKILSRITKPTGGYAEIRGRVGSLLEVGTGFHPELTGRENIFLNGAILGMHRWEINKKFDEIVAFAEIDQFLDTPVKRYSSGMYVRLAFAVAAHLDPEILIVDEVLAVGDAVFQKKCLGKMGEVAAKEGKTVLFVSHNIEAVSRLCTQAIFLQNGSLKLFDKVDTVINSYLQLKMGLSSEKIWQKDKAPGNEIVELIYVKAQDENGKVRELFNISEPVYISIVYKVKKSGYVLSAGINFFNERDINVFDLHDVSQQWRKKEKEIGTYCSTVKIPENFLSEGLFLIGVAILTPNPFYVHIHEKDVIVSNVVDDLAENSARGDYIGHFPGVVRPLMQWETKLIDSEYIIN